MNIDIQLFGIMIAALLTATSLPAHAAKPTRRKMLPDGVGYDVNRQLEAIANSGRKSHWATTMYETAYDCI